MKHDDTPTLDGLAARLRGAYDRREPIAPLRDELAGLGVDAAYQVQELNTRHWLTAGRRLVGRKIGLTSRSVQRQLGVDSPDFGMLFADMEAVDGQPIAVDRVLQAKAEAEIALVLERDLPEADLTMSGLMRAIAYALPAVEIVGSRIRDWDIRLLDTVADNASSGMFALGTQPRRLADVDLRLCGMVMERRGEVVSVGVGAACLGHPLNAALWLARKMVEVGRPLKAGDVVMTGALGPMVPVVAGDVLSTAIAGLGTVTTVFA